MNFRHQKAYAGNIYSANTQNKGPWHRLKSPATVSLCCFTIIVVLGIPRLFWPSKAGISLGSSSSSLTHRCWLKHALESGEFKLFSHRSYHDNTQSEQPTCHDSLSQLKEIGVDHIDLDLVLDERNGNKRIIVAHPMEFKHQSDYYSPCANMDFDEMVHTLKSVYGNEFFISMEPKAAWGNTRKELGDAALTNLPSNILDNLLEKIIEYDFQGNCAAIVEINKVAHGGLELEKQQDLLEEILQHCQLFRGIRLADDSPTSMGDYDILMPTIEFHPAHAHNTAGKVIPQSMRSKSIFWVVDNEADLALAGDMHPFGIVSNSPKNIVDIVKSSAWCVDI